MSATALRGGDVRVERLGVSAYRIPTDRVPETDGTARWSATTIVVVEIAAGGEVGTGWTYGTPAVAAVVDGDLRRLVEGSDALATRALWTHMNGYVRNAGRSGIASYAISAVDVALWDLRARLLGVALCDCLGIVRESVPVYGSGGFTSYDIPALQQQLAGWAHDGIRAVKMKVGRDHGADPRRVAAAREAIGPHVELFVDANGGYDVASGWRSRTARSPSTASRGSSSRSTTRTSTGRAACASMRRPASPSARESTSPTPRMRRSSRGSVDVAAGRRDALRRLHGVPRDRRLLRRRPQAAVDALRADAAPARRERRDARAAHGVVPRPRAHRAPAVRRGHRARSRSARCPIAPGRGTGSRSSTPTRSGWRSEKREVAVIDLITGVERMRNAALEAREAPPGVRPDARGAWNGDAEALGAALRARIAGEVRFDDGSRALYATDASNYRQVPIGVVVPRTVDDVVQAVAVADASARRSSRAAEVRRSPASAATSPSCSTSRSTSTACSR